MKNNKGFGMIAVLIIVVALLASGGVVYYLNKDLNKTPVNLEDENVLLEEQEQQNDSEEVSILDESTGPSSPCASTAAPSITVLSPNGGETYTAGQQITIKWTSCNGASNSQVMISLKSSQSAGSEMATVSDSGMATITLPTALYSGTIPLVSGKYYKIVAQLGGSAMGHIAPTDESDNLFTINSNLADEDCSTWLSFNDFGNIKYPSCWIASNTKGGSYGTSNLTVGMLLKPSVNSPTSDSISIGGWQYGCENVNVSSGMSPATKAYCIQSEGGNIPWTGQYITSINQNTIYGIPMVTHSTNSQVLNMFDQIVQHNI
ncbi:MAG: hypothetical protein ABH951_01050 [Patescibacteria group bacterium]